MSATATATPAARVGVQFVYTVECYCHCGERIPGFNLKATYDENKASLRRRVDARCAHCPRFYRFNQVLRNGEWELSGEVELVTDVREQSRIAAALGKAGGDRVVA